MAFSLYISRKLTIQYCFCLPVRSVSDLSRFLSRRVPPLVLARTTTRTSLISCIPSRRFPYSSRRFSSRRISSRRISSRRTSRVAHISRSRYLIRSIALFAILLIVTSSFVSITGNQNQKFCMISRFWRIQKCQLRFGFCQKFRVSVDRIWRSRIYEVYDSSVESWASPLQIRHLERKKRAKH